MINLLITIAIVLVTIILINKGFPSTYVFMFMGLLLAIYMTLTNTAVVATSSGSSILNIFEGIKESFVSTFSSIGLSMLPIYGYSIYMNKIDATSVLGSIISKPIKNAKNPYFVGIFMAIMVIGLMRIAIVSAVGCMALFMSTLYPALLKSGISRHSAMGAIFIGSCFDWGPADFAIAQLFSPITNITNNTDYFLKAGVKVMPIVLIVVALTSGFIMQAIDKKSGYKLGDHQPSSEISENHPDLPKFYAILPILPLLFILGFSPILIKGISISIVSAVIISLFIAIIVEFIRKKSIKDRLNDAGSFVIGMGECFGNLLVLAFMLQYFATMLTKLNGFKYLVTISLNAGISAIILLIILSLLLIISNLATGSGLVIGVSVTPALIGLATSLGMSFYAIAMPVTMAFSLRCLNLGTGIHMQYCAEMGDTTTNQLLKRMTIPAVIMYIVAFAASFILL